MAHDNNVSHLLVFNVVGHKFYEINMDFFNPLIKFGDGQSMFVFKKKKNWQWNFWLFTKEKKKEI